MMDQPPRSGLPPRMRSGKGWPSVRVLRFLAVVFTVTAAGSLVLVAADLVIARPPAGDAFITVLNALAAFLLWRRVPGQARA